MGQVLARDAEHHTRYRDTAADRAHDLRPHRQTQFDI